MSHILIAVDNSPMAAEVFKVGLGLAQKVGAKVQFLRVINRNVDYMPPNTGEVYADQWAARQHLAEDDLNKVKAEHPDIDIEVSVFIGDPEVDIIEQAIKHHSAFIVLGTHGRTGLSQLVLGSIAEYIVRHSPLPVIVVPYRTKVH